MGSAIAEILCIGVIVFLTLLILAYRRAWLYEHDHSDLWREYVEMTEADEAELRTWDL